MVKELARGLPRRHFGHLDVARVRDCSCATQVLQHYFGGTTAAVAETEEEERGGLHVQLWA